MTPEDNFIIPFPEIMNMLQSVTHSQKMCYTEQVAQQCAPYLASNCLIHRVQQTHS
jgi:hypothetical protein